MTTAAVIKAMTALVNRGHGTQDETLGWQARAMINGGCHPSSLVHVVRYPDGSINGLSSPLPPDACLDGYTESYRRLADWARLVKLAV